MDRRNKYYILLTWALCGGLLLYAAFFTYMNDFTKLSFSYIGNDICEVPKEVLESGTTRSGEYIVEFPVDLSHYTINYLRLCVDEVEGDNARLFFVGYDKTWRPVVEIADYPLTDGTIDIELSSQDFDLVGIAVYGPEKNVIEKVQFIETLEHKQFKTAIPLMVKVLAVYLVLTVLLLYVMSHRKKRYSKR